MAEFTPGLPMFDEPEVEPVWKDEKGKVFDPYKPLNGRYGRVSTRYFMVEGTGHFPADILRYDQSWAITGLGDPDDPFQPKRTVVLATQSQKGKHRPPTTGRWENFGWKVTHKSIHVDEVKIIIGHSSRWTGHCQRCGERTKSSTPSFFNSQTICLDCSKTERQHPDFNEARNQMERAKKRGDRTFLGIGWRG